MPTEAQFAFFQPFSQISSKSASRLSSQVNVHMRSLLLEQIHDVDAVDLIVSTVKASRELEVDKKVMMARHNGEKACNVCGNPFCFAQDSSLRCCMEESFCQAPFHRHEIGACQIMTFDDYLDQPESLPPLVGNDGADFIFSVLASGCRTHCEMCCRKARAKFLSNETDLAK